jgi:uncharacterized protein involved in exopolysaccharide biosynthesis
MSLPIRPPSRPTDAVPTSHGHPLPPPAAPPADTASDPIVDLARLRQLAGFPLRAVRRHVRVAAWVAAGVFVAVAALVTVMPRTYQVETRILAMKNVIMPLLNNPRRAVPTESDAPTRLASETVLERDNLLQIIRIANLVGHWKEIRSPIGRAKERVMEMLHRPLSDTEKTEMLVETLRQRMWVYTSDGPEGAVAIGVAWPEPRTALAIVQAAEENFLEQRHTTEVARIGESITIIQRYVAGARATIDSTLAVLSSAAGTGGAGAAPVLPRAGVVEQSKEVAGLQASLATRRAAIADLESARKQRILTVQTQLADMRKNYGPAHPEVQAAEQLLATLIPDSPQLSALRAEERQMVDRLTALGAPDTPPATPSTSEAAIARAALERLARQRADTLGDPRATYAQSQLKMVVGTYEDLLDRLQSANIELETARAAFKYRYNVVLPAQLPKKPVKPKVPLLIVGGMIFAVMCGVFAAVVLDVASGRVLEAWQVEQQLGLPVLGEVTPS